MNFVVEEKNDLRIMRLQEERLDSRIAADFKAQLLLMVGDENTKSLLIDLSQVIYADSSGLGALLLGLRQYRDNGKRFAIFGTQKKVQNLIKIAHVGHVLSNFETEEMAVESM